MRLSDCHDKTLDRHIESGGYGDVCLGHNSTTGEDVAVKIGGTENRTIKLKKNQSLRSFYLLNTFFDEIPFK